MSSEENQQAASKQAPQQQQEQRAAEPFKTCTFCGHVWPDRNAFLSDPQTVTVGYQSYLPDIALGLFLFNHLVCETTLALKAQDFSDLHLGPIYQQQLHGSEDCLGHCSRQDDLEACPSACECTWVREVLQVVKGWEKEAATTG